MSATNELTQEEEDFYSRLADAAERGEFTRVSAHHASEADAKEAGRAFLREVLGTDDLDALAQMSTPGRPSLSKAHSGESPMLRVRLPEDLNDAIESLAQHKKQNKSEVVRSLLLEGLKHVS
jgi:hypothetical protein